MQVVTFPNVSLLGVTVNGPILHSCHCWWHNPTLRSPEAAPEQAEPLEPPGTDISVNAARLTGLIQPGPTLSGGFAEPARLSFPIREIERRGSHFKRFARFS